MTAHAYLAALASAIGWLAALTILRQTPAMPSIKAILHALAALVPGLSVLFAHAPPPVAIVASAVLQLIALYSKPPAAAPKSSQAGFGSTESLAVLSAFVFTVAVVSVGCAAFRKAEADPATAVAKAVAASKVVGADVAKACAAFADAEKRGEIPAGKVKDDLDAACALDAAWRAQHPS